ncbi:MAG: NADH-quinone oxidoreductase subunit J [Candidatus Kapabacteria bacterium]|nr:NADH-quinone oxidoreductase subunit J [Ignavibacteriota bacterium]MCW5885300.1 NADH-quinone oxidoreductase subunit J [Candidatus Kapabacteria bacterium]
MTLTIILFGILAILAIASALVTILSKHPIRSAMGLVFHFFMLAGLYLTLSAQFIAALQVLVYAGAIMVLVIFVIMLLNLGDEESLKYKINPRQVIGVALGAALLVMLGAIYITNVTPDTAAYNAEIAERIGTAESLGNELYTNYILPVEAIGILLTAAIVGAIVLAKRKLS